MKKTMRRSTAQIERRHGAGGEVRSKVGDIGIEGYAAVFDRPADIGDFIEVIKPGAFRRALRASDVRCLLNHDPNYILGREKSGTLRLREDGRGLHMDCSFSDSPIAQGIHAMIRRGDITGASFGFVVGNGREVWRDEKTASGRIQTVREIHEVESLIDVGPVTFPAYGDTEVNVRSLWPEGRRSSIKRATPDGVERKEQICECDCPECDAGECANCSDPDCQDENCRCDRERSRRKPAGNGAKGNVIMLKQTSPNAYYRAFGNYLRFGLNFGLTPEERKLFTEAQFRMDSGNAPGAYPGSTAGFFAPVEFWSKVENSLKFYGDLAAVSTVIETQRGGVLNYPTANDSSVAGEMVAEDTQSTAADIPVGLVTFGGYKFSSRIVKVSMELAEDAGFDLEAYLAEQFAIRIARAANPKFTFGSGTNEPKGILSAATNSGVVVIGDDNATLPDPRTQVGYTDLVALESSVDVLYRRRGAWMLHDDTFTYIKTLKDRNGRPLWKSGMSDDNPNGLLLDRPVRLNQDMDKIGPGKKPVLFGDLSKYTIRTVPMRSVLRMDERFRDYGQIGFVAWARYDGNLLDAGTHPVKYIQQPA